MSEAPGEVSWHALEAPEALRRLDSSPEGLDSKKAVQLLQSAGPNLLEAEEGAGPLRLLLRQVNNPLIYLLAAAAVLSAVFGHAVDAAVIGGVILLNSLLGFSQEWRAEGALAALRQMAALHVRVLRGGRAVELPAAQVVPGDVLLLETGDRVPADARLLSGEELQVDESALTGESQPVSKQAGVLPAEVALADRRNLVWMSTNVTGGRGRAVVVATGMRTQMGRIAGQMRATPRAETPLQKRIHKLGVVLGLAGVALAAVVFGLGLLRGYPLLEMLMFAVAVAVSAIPEGLPAVINVTLALGVRRMAARGAIIRRLSAVETLGSTTVICTDKTGTVTRNQMTVRSLWAGGRAYAVSGEGYAPEGALADEQGRGLGQPPAALRLLLRIGVLCNNARLLSEEGDWRVQGNPSEGALLVVARKAGGGEPGQSGERLHELPFSSQRKYMATLHPCEGGRMAYVKGAADRLLEACTHLQLDDGRVELDAGRRREAEGIIRELASGALRVMAGAYREFPSAKQRLEPGDVERGLTLVGLWGMLDPPREESRQAVQEARAAGIHPVMITGDHADTALAIARQVGIAGERPALTGQGIDSLDSPALAAAALEAGVFARVSPGHKLKIMEALKEQGQVVAMTGDGVNDAPALKGADIGVAMGLAGTEVAKEAADMILTDDNFATIVHAVEEGRVIYSNLRRVVYYLLATNLGEILTLIAALLFGLDLPLTAVMLLWINLVTDGACTVPLGLEPGHRNVLRMRPRNPRAPLLDGILIRRMLLLTPLMAAGTLGLFWAFHASGPALARTIAFCTLAAFQWFQAFNARSQYQSAFSVGLFANKGLLLGIGAAVLLQVAVVYVPALRLLFGTTALSWKHWLWILLVSASIWLADEMLKLLGVHGRPSQG